METFLYFVMTHIVVAIHVLLTVVIFTWPKIYRWAFFPKREPDFEHRLYVYWFDEKVAYSALVDRKKLRFYEWDGLLYRDEGPFHHASKVRSGANSLAPEVQEAYKQHIHVKFEEIFLND